MKEIRVNMRILYSMQPFSINAVVPTADILGRHESMQERHQDLTTVADEALIAPVLADASHYRLIVERYEAKLDRYIRRLGVRVQEDREDVLQNIFIKAYRNLNGFDTSLSFSSWLYRIAHNEAISWYRKENVRPEGHLVDDAETIFQFVQSAELQPSAATIERLNAHEVHRALDTLPEKYRSVLILRFFEHKEYEDISDILKIPVGTVGTLLHRGKTRLATAINKNAVDV